MASRSRYVLVEGATRWFILDTADIDRPPVFTLIRSHGALARTILRRLNSGEGD